jgi:molybdate transport system substrate-binding protein
VQKPEDLASASVKHLALAGEKVPAGIYAGQALAKLDLLEKLTDKIVRGEDVRTALVYVERGEAEAGIVYATDVAASSQTESVYEFDPETYDEIVYVLVLLKSAGQNGAARKFYDFLASPEAARSFEKFGFQPYEGGTP